MPTKSVTFNRGLRGISPFQAQYLELDKPMQEKILIAGATGFTGSHVAQAFVAAGHPQIHIRLWENLTRVPPSSRSQGHAQLHTLDEWLAQP